MEMWGAMVGNIVAEVVGKYGEEGSQHGARSTFSGNTGFGFLTGFNYSSAEV